MEKENGPQKLAQQVKQRRYQVRLETSKALAEEMGITPRLVSDIENGKRESYSSKTLLALDKVLRWEPGSSEGLLNGDLDFPKLRGSMAQDSACDNANGRAELYRAIQEGQFFLSSVETTPVDPRSVLSLQDRMVLIGLLFGLDVTEFDLLEWSDYDEILKATGDIFRALTHSAQTSKPAYYDEELPSCFTRAELAQAEVLGTTTDELLQLAKKKVDSHENMESAESSDKPASDAKKPTISSLPAMYVGEYPEPPKEWMLAAKAKPQQDPDYDEWADIP